VKQHKYLSNFILSELTWDLLLA